MEKDYPPRQSCQLLNQLPQFVLVLKLPPKMCRVNRRGTYISATQAHSHPIMSIDSNMSMDLGMSVLRSHSTPTSTMVSGVPKTPSPSITWISTTLLGSTTMSMSLAQSMGMIPYVFSSSMTLPSSISTPPSMFSMGMLGYNAQSMPLVSNHFYFGMSNMTQHMSSFISTSNVNTSFGSGGISPPYNPFPFGRVHIPRYFPIVGGCNAPSFVPNPIYIFQGWNRHMGNVSTSCISSIYPPSTMLVPKKNFIMENHPPTYNIKSGGKQFYNIGKPPYRVSSFGGNVYPHMGNLYHIAFSSQASPSIMIPLQTFMNQVGGGYYPTRNGHGVY
jgi:hypothetical protein